MRERERERVKRESDTTKDFLPEQNQKTEEEENRSFAVSLSFHVLHAYPSSFSSSLRLSLCRKYAVGWMVDRASERGLWWEERADRLNETLCLPDDRETQAGSSA